MNLSNPWTEAEKVSANTCLERVLSSPIFSRSHRQQQFLRYIVAETIAGHAHHLKGYTIGLSVFGRDPTFDPVMDSIVRVEAARLRHKLREYYEGEGRSDPLRLDFPKGAYAVHIVRSEGDVPQALRPMRGPAPDPVATSPVEADLGGPASRRARPIEDKPSLAVLPFANMSSDREQEYFADGITDDLITELSKVSALFVIARHSAFVYKGVNKRVQDIGRELGVRYLLEGSVRRAADQVRVTAQLIDSLSGAHLWAERYDRELKGIFAVQDDVTRHIVDALELRLTSDDQRRLTKVGTDKLEAYDLCRRGNAAYSIWTPEALDRAQRFYEQAVATDPGYAEPHARLARVHTYRWTTGLRMRREESLDLALCLARKAIELDANLALAQGVLSWVCVWSGLHDKSVPAARRALELDPGGADTHYWLGVSLSCSGSTDEAELMLSQAMRFNPHSPVYYLWARAQNYLFMKRYREAIDVGEQAVCISPAFPGAHIVLAASYALAGHIDDAKRVAVALMRLRPNYGAMRRALGVAFTSEIADLYDSGLILAGL